MHTVDAVSLGLALHIRFVDEKLVKLQSYSSLCTITFRNIKGCTVLSLERCVTFGLNEHWFVSVLLLLTCFCFACVQLVQNSGDEHRVEFILGVNSVCFLMIMIMIKHFISPYLLFRIIRL